MKKFFVLICAAVMGLAACSHQNVQDSNTYYDANGKIITHAKDSSVYYDANGNLITDANVKGAKYQIIDQEFDNTRAPESDYDAIPAYELQACGDSYLPPVDDTAVEAAAAKGKAKAKAVAVSTKSTRAKRVTNTTNIYYVDGPNPNVPVSSTTTTKTVYTNGQVSSSTTSSSNTKTTVNPDGSVTTTTVNY